MSARWYIVHAYSNFEKKVAESIEEKARQKGLSHLFEKILVPTEKVVEVRRGRKVDAERKFFPGYVLVRADLTDEAYHLIKNTPKVSGFLARSRSPSRSRTPRPSAFFRRCRTGSSARSLRSPSRSASRSAFRTDPSPPSTAPSRMSTRSARVSRSRFRSSVAPRPWNSNTARSKRPDAVSGPS
jgi:hypothetical protein